MELCLSIFDSVCMIEKYRRYFGFRYEKILESRIVDYLQRRKVTLNTFVLDAFQFACVRYSKKRLLFRNWSGFVMRSCRKDKIDAMLCFEAEIRERLRNLAIAYRKSMAEILRVSLEVYLDYLDGNAGKIDIEKHYYSFPQDIIGCVVIGVNPFFLPKNIPHPYKKE